MTVKQPKPIAIKYTLITNKKFTDFPSPLPNQYLYFMCHISVCATQPYYRYPGYQMWCSMRIQDNSNSSSAIDGICLHSYEYFWEIRVKTDWLCAVWCAQVGTLHFANTVLCAYTISCIHVLFWLYLLLWNARTTHYNNVVRLCALCIYATAIHEQWTECMLRQLNLLALQENSLGAATQVQPIWCWCQNEPKQYSMDNL